MSQWSGSDSGILRKNPRTENHEELLVFGYSCKLFREDEKALYIDQGKHLIPWMGDETLKIDRYDCRGALSDLKKYEASREGFDAMRWLGLSDKERQLEELCDKERYYSLEINEEEEEMYKEEENKRQKTNTFQYSYDVPTDPEKKEEGPLGPEANDEEEYVPPPILDVPVDIDIPKTVKENARIEKTAKFVCKQGPQMEILIKAKQGNNPQFSFLNQGDKLYKFYRHVLVAFKNGRYQGYEPLNKSKTEERQDANDADADGHYLHPSLLSAAQQLEPPTTIAIPQVPYKPSANCAYSQLVNRIQGSQNDQAQDAEKAAPAAATNFAQMTYEQQQYYQYYYAQQYYEYYKQMALFQQGHGGNPGQFVPPPDFQNLDPNLQSYIQQIAYNQYLHHQQQQQSDNSYAQIVSNVNKDTQNPYAASVPQLPQNVPQKEEVPPPKNSPNVAVKNEESSSKTEVIVKKPLLSLAAYGSGSDTESEESTEEEEKEEEKKEVYKVPTGDTQVIIDKMALYVSKNGEQFESLVKARGDPRFDFLNDGHEYNKYYREKIRELKGGVQKEDDVEKKEVKEVKHIAKKDKKTIAPVSFSIKKAKEEQPKEIKSALPVEESDEEESENDLPPVPAPPIISSPASPPAPPTISIDENSDSLKETAETVSSVEENETETKENVKENKKNGILDVDDPILEMIELTSGEAVEDKKDLRRAEDKIKDKLAAAAREKLSSASRDRALQLERKKKAAAFLKLKSAETNTQTNETTAPDRDSPSKSVSRRSSVEIIEIPSSPVKRSRERTRSRDRDRDKRKDRDSKERRREERQRKRERSGEKRRSRTPRRESMEDETENKRRREDERKEKKKKSHRRKHSKSGHESRTKKKSKKRHRRSESESGSSNSS